MILKNICETKGKSFKELSVESGVSLTYLYELERGVKNNPSLFILMSLATALDVSLEDLIEKEC